MKPHNIVVDGYKASPDNLELGTYGSYGNEILKFCFKDGWDDTTSVIAVFNSNLDNPTSVLVESDGICKVPHEATDSITNDGRITLVGYKDNAKIISLDLSFVVYNHSAVDGEPPQEPTPNIFQQILDVSKDAVDTANEAKEIASKSYEETKQYAEQAKQSADSAAQNAEIAKENADKVVSVKYEVDSAKQQALTEIDDSKTNAVHAIGTAEANALGAISKSQSSAISSIQASEKNALDNISDLKSSALSDIDDAKTSSVNAVNSASQTAQSDITNLKTQSLEEIDAKKAESLQDISTAKTDAVDTVQGAQSDAETAISKAKTGALENIATEKEASVKAVNDAGSTATSAIADAKSDALSEIETAKTGAVEAVTAEGDKQAERVQAIFPAVTADDNGKVPIVQNGAWTLGEVAQDAYTRAESDARYAPIESSIRPTANGNPAVCEDSIAWSFQGLKVYGKSTQDGTPSPENPVPIVSAGDGGSIGLTVSNSADQSQQLTISTPNGLPGIPVDSGGSYVDASGQQLLCDVVDLDAKALISNIVKATFNGGFVSNGGIANGLFKAQHTFYESLRNLNIPSICDMFVKGSGDTQRYVVSFGFLYVQIDVSILKNRENSTIDDVNAFFAEHPVTVIAQRSAPITTPLSDEEVAAYRALTTYPGTTVVSTTESVAGIEAQYVVDPQKYIEKQVEAAVSKAITAAVKLSGGNA